MTTWLLQTNLVNQEHLIKIGCALKNIGANVEETTIIPFSDELTYSTKDPVIIPYGSTTMIKNARKRGFKGLYFNDDNLRTTTWNDHREDMLNSDSMTMSMDEAFFFMDWNYGEYFIRPYNDLKDFSGNVISSDGFKEWYSNASSNGYVFNEKTLVSISHTKEIEAEWRWFIVGGKVIDGCIYRVNGQLNKQHEKDKSIIQIAQGMADKWLPDNVIVMDTCLSEGQHKVVEFNCFNASGFYDHDIERVMKAVEEYTSNKVLNIPIINSYFESIHNAFNREE